MFIKAPFLLLGAVLTCTNVIVDAMTTSAGDTCVDSGTSTRSECTGIQGIGKLQDICCAAECCTCGGTTSSNDACLVTEIRDDPPGYCDGSEAMSEACIITAPSVADSCGVAGIEGVLNGDLCCPIGCGQCGGSGCGSLPMSWVLPGSTPGSTTAPSSATSSAYCCTTAATDAPVCGVAGAEPPCLVTEACPDGSTVCGDPHMQGLRGQKIDWSGVDGTWYCLLTDDSIGLHVNVRLTAPLPKEFPDRQLITGVSVLSQGTSLVIEVNDPYTVATNGCPEGVSPCLADGGLRVVANGVENKENLRSTSTTIKDPTDESDGIVLSASNLPIECRQFGGDKIWATMYEQMLRGKRVLLSETFEQWVLRFEHMAAPDWCAKFVTKQRLTDVQSNHAIFRIETPSVSLRVNVGTNYQGGDGETDWDGAVLPDLQFWQMDVGFEGLNLAGSLSGILGETADPVVDDEGRDIMEGIEAVRGAVEDYKVSGALGTHFEMLDMRGN